MAAPPTISKAERSYIQAGVLANPPSRADGRALFDFRTIALETGVAPLANGSARLSIGKGTEVLVATKLEVEHVEPGAPGVDGGRVVCSVVCSPAAYPHLAPGALDDAAHDLTDLLHTALAHRAVRPAGLGILAGRRAWAVHVDAVVLADAGNVADALLMGARAALCDTRVPRTRGVEYHARRAGAGAAGKGGAGAGEGEGTGGMDVDEEGVSGFDTRQVVAGTDFELPDYWDEGAPLARAAWPLCVTLNMVEATHFVDATLAEEAAAPLRVLLLYAFDDAAAAGAAHVHGMRTLGSGELSTPQLAELLKVGEKYARGMWAALDAKLRDEAAGRVKERTKF